MANHAEAGAPHDIRGQSEIDQVENVEELAPELQGCRLTRAAMAERRVLDQRHVKAVESRTVESIAPQRSESPLIGSCATGHADGDEEKRGIVAALPEVILSNRPTCGENRLPHLIGPVGVQGSRAGLLHAGVNRERRAAGQGADVQQFPTGRHMATQPAQEVQPVKGQRLDHVDRQNVPGIKSRRPFFRARIPRILGKGLQQSP